jgi:hypothetical protein
MKHTQAPEIVVTKEFLRNVSKGALDVSSGAVQRFMRLPTFLFLELFYLFILHVLYIFLFCFKYAGWSTLTELNLNLGSIDGRIREVGNLSTLLSNLVSLNLSFNALTSFDGFGFNNLRDLNLAENSIRELKVACLILFLNAYIHTYIYVYMTLFSCTGYVCFEPYHLPQ